MSDPRRHAVVAEAESWLGTPANPRYGAIFPAENIDIAAAAYCQAAGLAMFGLSGVVDGSVTVRPPVVL